LFNIPIKNGIGLDILNDYIGHFPDTSYFNGNIGLAAHNRGYINNYFMDINKLKNNDEIIYKLNGKTRIYEVYNKVEIDSYDWSYLENTNNNIITLITCIANKPNNRLVVQGIEKGGNNK
jgi:sortase A